MDINFEWPGDLDHDRLNELFKAYAKAELDFIKAIMAADPTVYQLDGEEHEYSQF